MKILTFFLTSHVHETIQPVIHKEVVQPEVVHTTVPVHEVHHNAAQHHGTTTLPPVHIDEFKKQGGVLSGHQERRSQFDGCPEGVHADGSCPDGAHPGRTAGHTSSHPGIHSRDNTNTGLNQSSTTSTSHSGLHTTGEGREGSGRNLGGSVGPGHTNTNTTTDTTTKKPSLLDRLNPMKDADHDGKKGMMD